MTSAIPPSRVLYSMLGGITDVLARELVEPSGQTPDWSEAEWRLARAVAAIHGVSGLLANGVAWPDAPRVWASFLADQRQHIASRHLRIEEALRHIEDAARTEGIALLGMKGSALRKLGVYAPGERPMADVDLLARPDDLQRVAHLLQSIGFCQGDVTPRHSMFEPKVSHAPASLGECSANDVKIELHTLIREQLPLLEVDITDSVFPSDQPAGLRPYPSTAELMLHLILHAAGNMVIRTLRLVQLHDLGRLTARMSDVDWDGVLRLASGSGGNGWWLYPPLALTRLYTGAAVPEAVLEFARRGCPRQLATLCRGRELTGFSLSNPWVALFPALCWTRFGPERMRYLYGRLVRTRVSVYRQAAFSRNPVLAEGAWKKLSGSRRLVSWALGRAPRLGTLAAIEAAFAERNGEPN
jgi:hypothetical protein